MANSDSPSSTSAGPPAEPVARDSSVTRTIPPSGSPAHAETVDFSTAIGRGPSAIATGELIGGRYRLTSEIARGGMGAVFAARDTTLNRDVAVKLLLDRYGVSSSTASRFIEEAKIAGQLQHAGIPPVHDLGTLEDGRPFLAMKLIKGQTLATILANKSRDLASLVELFAEIVDAIAYAHNKGVIHRDLKPGNVMVGAFGEVQVMDWGLAKTLGLASSELIARLDARASASVSMVETGRTPDSATQAGSILGTPAYMPPEQAKGLIEQTDARSDVFALGAILCEILTGKPPYIGDTFDEIRAQSIMGLTRPAIERLEASGADPELVALAALCLDPDPMKRPADASAIGKALAAYQTGVANRLKRAEHDMAAAEVRAAELKKRWRLIVTTAFGLTSAAVGFALFINSQNRKLEAETAKSQQAKADADTANQAAQKNALLAQRRLEKAVEAVEQVMVRVAGEKWALKPELQKERREVLEEAIAYFKSLGQGESGDPTVRRQAARANLYAATAYISLGEYDKCREAVTASQELYRGLQKDFPDDSTFVRGEAECESLLGHADAIAAKFSSALAHYETVLTIAKKAIALDAEREDNQLALIDAYSSLALFYSFQRPDLSRQYHASALALGETLLAKPSPGFKARLGVSTALVNLAVTELNTNRSAAEAKFERAEAQLAILDRLTPPNARAAEMLLSTKAGLAVYQGVSLVRAGKVDDGLKRTKAGIDLLSDRLKVQGKSFPFQIQHIQFQVIYADMLTTAGRTAEAASVMEAVKREQDAIAREQPQLTWIRGLGTVQRSNLIIHQLRNKYDPEFEEQAKQLLEADATSTTPAVKYNVACLYAQAAILAPEKDRERFAARAVEFLNELLATTDYLRNARNVSHLDKDTDLDPIRRRDDFKAFLAKARMGVKSSPPKSPEKSVSPDGK